MSETAATKKAFADLMIEDFSEPQFPLAETLQTPLISEPRLTLEEKINRALVHAEEPLSDKAIETGLALLLEVVDLGLEPETISALFGELHCVYQWETADRFKQVSLVCLDEEAPEIHYYQRVGNAKSTSYVVEATPETLRRALVWLQA